MVSALSRNWWVLALRGAIAVLFGLMALAWPGITLEVLVLFFGAWALVDGIFSIVGALRGQTGRPRWMMALGGIVGILVWVVTLLDPVAVALAFVYLIAAWALITGLFEIGAAFHLRKEMEGEWILALSGVVSVVFGLLIALWPGAAALAFVWMIGAYAIIFGVLLLVLAFKLRGRAQTMQAPAAA
jgi:uncharacterized membrane protein HdeD (DUF308 family)